MTDHESLFAAIQSQQRILEKQSEQLSNIEKSLVSIAVQGKEINHLEASVNKLWDAYDKLWGPNGVMSDLKTYQSSCPAESLKKSIDQIWVTIWTCVTLIIGLIGALKVWG